MWLYRWAASCTGTWSWVLLVVWNMLPWFSSGWHSFMSAVGPVWQWRNSQFHKAGSYTDRSWTSRPTTYVSGLRKGWKSIERSWIWPNDAMLGIKKGRDSSSYAITEKGTIRSAKTLSVADQFHPDLSELKVNSVRRGFSFLDKGSFLCPLWGNGSLAGFPDNR